MNERGTEGRRPSSVRGVGWSLELLQLLLLLRTTLCTSLSLFLLNCLVSWGGSQVIVFLSSFSESMTELDAPQGAFDERTEDSSASPDSPVVTIRRGRRRRVWSRLALYVGRGEREREREDGLGAVSSLLSSFVFFSVLVRLSFSFLLEKSL